MEGFKRVDPSFPDRIMRMTEESTHAQNKALLTTTKLESWSVLLTSIGYTVLP